MNLFYSNGFNNILINCTLHDEFLLTLYFILKLLNDQTIFKTILAKLSVYTLLIIKINLYSHILYNMALNFFYKKNKTTTSKIFLTLQIKVAKILFVNKKFIKIL